MCDTLVAVGNASIPGAVTLDGSVILAKNSDREPNEAQALTYVPRAQHAPGETVACTYLTIPQAPETYAAILSRPTWMWGAEMGLNEWGVAIGNEAVFTRVPYTREAALTGMDLLRLALERATTARAALDVIVTLLTRHDQGGNCGYRHPLYYHNSYILADPTEAWVLETAGRHWAAQKVTGTRSISNGLTIGAQWDLASPGLEAYARQQGWCRPGETFDFARCYSDPLYTTLDGCRQRCARSTQLLQEGAGQHTPARLMATLRDHGPRATADPTWAPNRGLLMTTLCAHASLGPLRGSQSTGSLVAHLRPGDPVAWFTGTSAPCTGIFKPTYPALGGLPDGRVLPAESEPGARWWAHESLHRAVLQDYATRMPVYRAERDALEAEFVAEAAAVGGDAARSAGADRLALTARCFARAEEAEARWAAAVAATEVKRGMGWGLGAAWRGWEREAGREG
jgi:dipeptidase